MRISMQINERCEDHRRRILPKIFLILIIAGIISFPSNCWAKYPNTPIDSEALRGVDTIVVGLEAGPLPSLIKNQFDVEAAPEAAVVRAVMDVFSKQPSLPVLSIREYVPKHQLTPNVLGILFILSTQTDSFNGTPSKVTALSVRIAKGSDDGGWRDIHVITPVSFPFIVPEDHKKFLEKLTEGVKFLISYLPTYVYCENRTSKEETPCSKSFEEMHPWGVKKPSYSVY